MSHPVLEAAGVGRPVCAIPLLRPGAGLCIDFDGTLVELAATPDSVQVPERVPRALRALHGLLDGAVAVVSGRRRSELLRLLGALPVTLVGVHGADVGTNGPAPVCQPLPPDLLRHAYAIAAAWPGSLVEDKGVGVSLHWRGAPGAAPAFIALAEATARVHEGWRVQRGNAVVELLPASATKGNAVRALGAHAAFAHRTLVYVGDDLADEDGFSAALSASGRAIIVGARSPSRATERLSGPAAVLDWLEASVTALRTGVSA